MLHRAQEITLWTIMKQTCCERASDSSTALYNSWSLKSLGSSTRLSLRHLMVLGLGFGAPPDGLICVLKLTAIIFCIKFFFDWDALLLGSSQRYAAFLYSNLSAHGKSSRHWRDPKSSTSNFTSYERTLMVAALRKSLQRVDFTSTPFTSRLLKKTFMN